MTPVDLDRGVVLSVAAALGALVASAAALATTWLLDRKERR